MPTSISSFFSLPGSYLNYKIIRIKNVPDDSVDLLAQLVDGYNDDVDPEDENILQSASFWGRGPVQDQPVDVLIAPDKYNSFKGDLGLLKLSHKASS